MFICQVNCICYAWYTVLICVVLGSRRVFGTVVHSKVAVLIDTSGSMDQYIDELKKELASLVWDQLYRHGAK